jgi:hypothetical protein
LAHHAHCLLELCDCGRSPEEGLEEGQKLLVLSMVKAPVVVQNSKQHLHDDL